jgi:hypothetical protein
MRQTWRKNVTGVAQGPLPAAGAIREQDQRREQSRRTDSFQRNHMHCDASTRTPLEFLL